MLYQKSLAENHEVCPKCDHHMRITARRRIELFLDEEGQQELTGDLEPVDMLKFKDLKRYKDRLNSAQKGTGEKDARMVVQGTVSSVPVVVAAVVFGCIGGSMGAVVGEKFVQAVNTCLASRQPLVCFSSSGGARMQEALVSLMQLAKTSAALEKMRKQGLPYISVLVDPVYGGVSASLAMLGDVNIAEPNALVGFTGPTLYARPSESSCQRVSARRVPVGARCHRYDCAPKELRGRIAALLEKLMYYRLPIVESPASVGAVESSRMANSYFTGSSPRD